MCRPLKAPAFTRENAKRALYNPVGEQFARLIVLPIEQSRPAYYAQIQLEQTLQKHIIKRTKLNLA